MCFIAAPATGVTHNAASLLVLQWPDRAHPVHWTSQRTAHGVSSIAVELFSHAPIQSLTMLITVCCLASQNPLCPYCACLVLVCVGGKHSMGFESHCDDQETEAHYSNAHLIAQEKRFYLHQPRKTSNSD